MVRLRRWAVVIAVVFALDGAAALAQPPPARRPPPTRQRRATKARPAGRPATPLRPGVRRPVPPRVPVHQPYRAPWLLRHLGIILGVGIPVLIFGLSFLGWMFRKARAVPRLHHARKRFAALRQTILQESKLARGGMDVRQQRALFNFSAQEYAAAASDLVSIATHHRETLEKVENEARQLSRTLDAVAATEGEREADAIADDAEREANQLEEYGGRLTDILRERLEALTALQAAQAAAGQRPTAGRQPQMTISTMAALADSRVHCRSCGGPLDPAAGAVTCAYCGNPIVPL